MRGRSICFRLAPAVVATALATDVNAQAFTVLGTPVDDPCSMELILGWNPEQEGSFTSGLVNWGVTLTIRGAWEGTWSVQHLVDTCHRGLDRGQGDPMVGSFSFRNDAFGEVVRDMKTARHRTVFGEDHQDRSSFRFLRNRNPAFTRVIIDGSHVPEPCALAALGAGLLALARRRRR